MKQARRQTLGRTYNHHIRHPRRPGRSTATTTIIVDRQVKPSGTDSKINGKTGNFGRIKLLREQDEEIREFHLQEETDEQLKEKTVEAVKEDTSENLKLK